MVGLGTWVMPTVLDIGVVDLVDPFEHDVSTSPLTASVAPSLQAVLSQGFRGM
jgi:hypothetical protein